MRNVKVLCSPGAGGAGLQYEGGGGGGGGGGGVVEGESWHFPKSHGSPK